MFIDLLVWPHIVSYSNHWVYVCDGMNLLIGTTFSKASQPMSLWPGMNQLEGPTLDGATYTVFTLTLHVPLFQTIFDGRIKFLQGHKFQLICVIIYVVYILYYIIYVVVYTRSGSAPLEASPSRGTVTSPTHTSSHKKSSCVDSSHHNNGKPAKVKPLVRERWVQATL